MAIKTAREELLESAERFLKACLEAQAATKETLKILEEYNAKHKGI